LKIVRKKAGQSSRLIFCAEGVSRFEYRNPILVVALWFLGLEAVNSIRFFANNNLNMATDYLQFQCHRFASQLIASQRTVTRA
jgi:hypothetical protein